MNGYEVLMTEKINLVLPEGFTKNLVPLDFVIKKSPNPFIIFGLPKKVKKYIEKHAKFIPNIKTKYPKIKALVQSPVVGGIIDIGTAEEKISYWFEKGIYVMSLEEAKEYSKYFNVSFFTMDPTIKMILNSLDVANS